MHKKIIYFIILLTLEMLLTPLFSQEISFKNLPYKKNLKDKIADDYIFSESKVTSEKNKTEQKLLFSIAGLHPKSCEYSLRILSRYENFSHYIDFIKISEYDDETKTLRFFLSHTLLPYDMSLTFVLPRITKVGTYPFIFEIGPLKGLSGKIHVSEYKNRCFFYSTANWQGKDTGFPNIVFELFSQTLSKISMEILFRISSTLSH